MPRTSQELVNANFSSGIITETGPLGYPENSVKDMLNMELQRNGSVRVRNGLTVDNPEFSLPLGDADSLSVHYWDNPGNDGVSFLVAQIGNYIRCIEATGTDLGKNTISATTVIDGLERSNIAEILRSGGPPSNLKSVQSRSRLYMSSKETGPFYLEYLPEGRANSVDFDYGDSNSLPTVQIVTIRPEYRDLNGLSSGVDVDVRPRENIPEHHYNILNAGWPEEDYQLFHRGKSADRYPDFDGGRYPALADYYWSGWGLNQSQSTPEYEEFLPALILREPVYNTPASMGHFILDVFNPNRSEISGVEDLPSRGLTEGPVAIGFFAGRAWYAGFTGGSFEDNVLFSNVLPSQSNVKFSEEYNNYIDGYASQCYQKNDPTARDVNDLVDDDGGVIPIPGVGRVMGMVSLKSSIIVVSDKGAWSISGGIDPFSANNYSVNKITSVGCISPNSIVELEGAMMFWGYGDIVLVGEQQGQSVAQSITDNSIKTLYVDIPLIDKKECCGHYDIVEKKVYWSYGDQQVLIFDTVLQAFYRYEFNSEAEEVKPTTVINSERESTSSNLVVGDNSIVSGEDNVVLSESRVSSFQNQLIFCLRKNNYLLLSRLDYEYSGNYYDLIPKEYESYTSLYPVRAHLEIGATGFGDLQRKKQVFRVSCFFETKGELCVPATLNYDQDTLNFGPNSGFELLNQSSCLVQGRWEWATRFNSGRYSQKHQAYRNVRYENLGNPDFPVFVDLNSNHVDEYGAASNTLLSIASSAMTPMYEVHTAKMRIRGRGRTLNMYFENEAGKGFHLLGWAAPAVINQRP